MGTAVAVPGRPLVVTQVPVGPEAAPAMPWPADGARIVGVSVSGKVQVLSRDFHSAADPDVSFDGRRVVFAAQRTAEDPWCIHEMNVDGTGERELTCGPGMARRPVYLSRMYTLTATSTEPWEQIAFVGSPTEGRTHSSLYTCKLDGSSLRRLTFSLTTDSDPTLLPDGRIVYTARPQLSSPDRARPSAVLFGVNLDGTDQMIFARDEGHSVKRMPAATTDGRVVFVEGDGAADGGGTLAAVLLRRSLHSYRSLTPSTDGLFHSPAAHPDGGLLVSWRANDGRGTYGVYRVDAESGRRRTRVFDDPAWHDVQARMVAVRSVPDGRSSSVRDDDPLGKLYGLDVNITDVSREMLPPGTGVRLRLLEGEPLRILGEAPLAADGSFHLQVPADTPLQIQMLDADGLALRRSAWIWARRHESRGCIGCHEDPERTPPNRLAAALGRPAVVLAPPEAERRAPDFRHDVLPIVERRCLSCHGASGTPPSLAAGSGDPARGAREVYDRLLAEYVEPGKARASRLTWHLLGRVTSRPWDPPGGTTQAIPPASAPTPEEIRALVEWIDVGAVWDRGGDR